MQGEKIPHVMRFRFKVITVKIIKSFSLCKWITLLLLSAYYRMFNFKLLA